MCSLYLSQRAKSTDTPSPAGVSVTMVITEVTIVTITATMVIGYFNRPVNS